VTAARRGHRCLPHTADVIVEAWGPSLAACAEEAVAGLLGTCLDAGRSAAAPTVERRTVHLPAGPPDTALLALLEEVVFVLDTSTAVPVGAAVRPAADGSLDVVLRLVAPADVEFTGAVPKAVSRSGLSVERRAGGVRCTVLVDV
jgi:SHS2 domain-containing protein